MQFSKIAINSSGVHLVRQVVIGPSTEEIDLQSREKPLGSFVDALQAFGSYVNDLLDVPKAWRDKLKVTTVNLSAAKDGRRGLMVSVTYPVAKADDKVVSLTTPLILEPMESGAGGGYTLDELHLELIETLEAEATRYVKGERLQGELFDKKTASANAKAADERMAQAEVASTRKPKGKGKLGGQAAPGELQNPEKTVAPSTSNLHELLKKVGKDVPVDAIERWGSADRDLAQSWAEKASKGKASSMPLCIQRDAIKQLVQSQPHVQ